MISILSRSYLAVLFLVGAGALVASIVVLLVSRDPSEITSRTLLFVALAVPAGWLRIKLEPSGHLTLAPVLVIVSMFLANPAVPVLVAALSALASVAVFAREGIRQGLEEAGEEAIPAGLAVWLVHRTDFSLSEITRLSSVLAFGLVLLMYILARLLFSMIRANLSEGIRPSAFLLSSGKTIVVNSVIFAAVALGMVLLVRRFDSLGYLTLALAMVALVESYHPFKLLGDQRDVLYASLSMIARAIDLKDPYTGRHARDASEVAVRIARVLGLPESEVRKVRVAGILHDIGKIGVSGKIIRKPLGLSPEEMASMRGHPTIGSEIMRPVELLADAAEIVRHHHEHFDGSGYPDGLGGNEIPMGSRIVLVADAFNAMTTDRPYRRARSKAEAMRVLKENSGKQFDPRVVRAVESIAELL